MPLARQQRVASHSISAWRSLPNIYKYTEIEACRFTPMMHDISIFNAKFSFIFQTLYSTERYSVADTDTKAYMLKHLLITGHQQVL